MAFDNDAVFPLELSKLTYSTRWNDIVVEVGSGAEQRAQLWNDSLRKYDAILGIKTLSDYRLVEKHFNGRRGRTRGFPLLDRSLFQATTEAFGEGNGVTASFQLAIAQGDSYNAYSREIYKVVPLSETIYDNASPKTRTTHYTINNNTGVVTFTGGNIPAAGHILTATFQFYIPCRYSIAELPPADLFIWSANGTQLVNGPSIPIQEIRDIA